MGARLTCVIFILSWLPACVCFFCRLGRLKNIFSPVWFLGGQPASKTEGEREREGGVFRVQGLASVFFTPGFRV